MNHPTIETEIWKDVVNYEGLYQVSNLGRIKSLERKVSTSNGKNMTRKEKVLKPSLDTKGYLQIRFYINGHFPSNKVHRLVARAFLDDFELDKQINHLNGIKTDNRVINLECVTNQENMTHRYTILTKKPRGVLKQKNRWRAQARFRGNHYFFGSYKTKEEAYRSFYKNYKRLSGIEPWDLEKYPTHKEVN